MSLFETGIRPAIDAHLLALSRETRDYGSYWSASSAGYCIRKNIFERLGVPKVESDADARKQRVFTAGHLFHSWIQNITKATGMSIAQETELIDDDIMVKGHFDDLVKTDDGLILYDYKTQNSRAFSYKRDKMSHFHRMQLGTYLYMIRKSDVVKQPVNEGRILKISKDDMRMSEEQLLWTPDLEKDVVGYWNTINGYWNKKTLPKCTCADFEGGFMAREQYNGYFKDGEPCSIKLYEEWKSGKDSNLAA